ncbi:MAG: potassium transporter TrkG, partial [Acidobacteriota bacterium]
TTAAVLWKIYLGLSGLLVALLMLAGLDLYDALTHAFSTLSTGGFSPKNASVAAFGSPLVEVIVMVFMVLAGANFSLYYGLRQAGGWRGLLHDTELRIYLGLIVGVSAVVAWHLAATRTIEVPGRALLDSCFQVVAVLTTTGFATADFNEWPPLSRFLIVSLMFVGGCAGSTSGGVKIMRFVIGLKAAIREVRLMYSPSHVMAVWIGGKAVPDAVARSVVGFFMLYFASWAFGTLALTVGGNELEIAATASITTLGNIGPALGWAGPSGNFSAFLDWQKVLMVGLMWVGRLEVYAIAALFTVAFWRR